MKTKVRRPYVHELFQKQNGRCCYCDRPMILAIHPADKNKPLAATLEHLKLGRRRGWNHPDNLAAACRECNGMRGAAKDWLLFKSYRLGELWDLITPRKKF
ncbi:HNH endonuclease [Rhizobium sp. 3T7]|uniref:HNH endonuclease n=1 Tax=Rhizobium sp. 3T7 TaxID=2874922 RepID=UPI001CC94998|nr:HNH endonuclease [Rhizobium sp. 3T7]MBZ9792531.1 HNH endonuclease [Rhizobium sp. 3T7]